MASLRKRPVLIDTFDSVDKGTFDSKPKLAPIPHASIELSHSPQLTLYQSLEVLTVLMKDYQSKFQRLPDSDPMHLWFPYAWTDLKVGDEVRNLNTKAVYFVEEIIADRTPVLRNYVRIKGMEAPKDFHSLRLDSKKNRLINIVPAYPDTEIKPYDFTSEGHIRDEEGSSTWTDAITYSIVKESPGSRDRTPFGSNQELTPRYRETIGNTEIYNQIIETAVRFDFWTRSNASSEQLREWFRDFSHKYMWLMTHNGINRFHWTGSFTATNATRWRPGIVHRSAEYYFRTEYSTSTDASIIRNTDVQVVVPDNPSDPSSNQININISN